MSALFLSILALSIFGCDALSGTSPGSSANSATSKVGPEASTGGRSATQPTAAAAPALRSGKPPVYVLLYTHHYLGLGGYYPTAPQVEAVVDACVEADMAPHCTLFFDGMLVDQLAGADPGLGARVKQQGFPIGYHGEEAHGPYPVIVSLQVLNQGKGEQGQGKGQDRDHGLYKAGMSFAELSDSITQRYSHGYRDPTFDSQGYLSRAVGGSSTNKVGGVDAVKRWTGSTPQILPGHSLFQPAASPALDQLADGAFLQAAGPFAPHFLGGTHNAELAAHTGAFLGQNDLLFWYMGHLAEKGSDASMFPMWNTASLVQKVKKNSSQAGAGQRAGGRGQHSGKGRGKGQGRGQGGDNRALKQKMLAQRGGGAAGEGVQDAAAALDRSRPHLVSMKIDGAKEDVAATLSFMAQWTHDDPSVVLVSPQELRSHVGPSMVSMDARQTAQAVLASWSGGPADTLSVSGVPLSQADAFEVLARHLAGGGDVITTTNVLGPIAPSSALVQGTGTVTAAELRAAAVTAVAAMDQSPLHAMPVAVEVGKTTVGFHQLHWLMASLVATGGDSFTVPTTGYAPPFAAWLADALGRSSPDPAFWMECQYWTIKPAVWL